LRAHMHLFSKRIKTLGLCIAVILTACSIPIGHVKAENLPNYRIQTGTLFEDFESIGDWTISGTGASAVADTVNFKTGTQGIKLNSVNGVSAYMTKTINKNFSSVGNITLWFYLPDKTNNVTQVMIYLASTTNVSTMNMNVEKSISGDGFNNGWNKIVVTKDDFTSTGGEAWSNTMIRMMNI